MTLVKRMAPIAFALAFCPGAIFVSMLLAEPIQRAQDAPQPLSPEESAASMRLPKGFRIELVASEPLIQDPTCTAFDAQGRLFVCELHGYNLEGHLDVVELNKMGVLDTTVRRIRWEREDEAIAEEARNKQYGTVKLLTDTDGDGRMDRADIWADKLPTCYGILPAHGGLIVVGAPDIIYLADKDGDGKAEVRETLYTGFRIELLERGINNPRWGLDDWIYVGAGGGGGDIRGPRLAESVNIGNTDFRIKADGSAIEPVNGTVGTFGLTLGDFGDRFPSSGGGPAMYALPLPHRYLRRNPFVSTPPSNHTAADYVRCYRISAPHPWRVKRGEDPAWVKFYGERETNSGYFTGGCGGEIYRASRFPEPYRGNFFYCEPSLNVIHRCLLERDGPGYKVHRAAGEGQSEFLASTDQWFRPINLRVGPDGALYIVDMYREIIEDYSAIPRFLQQQYGIIEGADHGRIWRLVHETTKGRSDFDLAHATTAELVRATGDANAWWRRTAQRLLIERADKSAAPALAAQVRKGTSPQARVHALRTLHGLGALSQEDIAHALGDASFGVRMHALQLAGERFDSSESESADELLAKALTMADDPDPRVRLQLAMTLGESRDSQAIDALLHQAKKHGGERWMSTAILSSARDSAAVLLIALLDADGARHLLAPLAATLAGSRDAGQVEKVLGLLAAVSEASQVECLKGFVAGLPHDAKLADQSPDGWQSVKKLLGGSTPGVRMLVIQLGARLQLTDSPEFQAAFATAARQALDAESPLDIRERNIELLASAAYTSLAPTVSMLLDARQPPALQLAAIRALAASEDDRVGRALVERWKGLTPQLRSEALQTLFSRENRLSALLDALENGEIQTGEINALRREQLIKSQSEALASRAKKLFENPTANAQLLQRIKLYQEALAGPHDTKKGGEVFAKHCLNCHKMKDQGHQVGPELGSVINKPDEAILLDLLDPSSHVESEFGSYIVVTQDGNTFTGLLASDSATSVTLKKEKGESATILRKDIELMQASELSLMPSNFHELITSQETADLIAYLREMFGKAPSTPPIAAEK